MGPTMEDTDRQRIVELLKQVEATAGKARAIIEEHGQSPLSLTEGGMEDFLVGSLRQKVGEIWELYGSHDEE